MSNSFVFDRIPFEMIISLRSDVQKMEKEQEVERERDRARSTKFFEPKFNFSEPPPKVGRTS